MSQPSAAQIQDFSGLPSPLLIIGAAYSGKSELAHKVCRRESSTAIVGTADLSEAFLEARVKELRKQRPDHWVHYNGRDELDQQIGELSERHEQILVDSINQWIANLVLRHMQKYSLDHLGPHIEAMIDQLVLSLTRFPGHRRLVLVTSEVGAGISPPRPVGRLFRQLVGRCNTRLAASCNTVLSLTAGIPLVIKEV